MRDDLAQCGRRHRPVVLRRFPDARYECAGWVRDQVWGQCHTPTDCTRQLAPVAVVGGICIVERVVIVERLRYRESLERHERLSVRRVRQASLDGLGRT